MVIFPTWDLERSHDKKPSKNIRRLNMEFHIKKTLSVLYQETKEEIGGREGGRKNFGGKKTNNVKKKPQKQTGFEVI